MGRKKRAWLTNGTGIRVDRKRILPGRYVEWNEDGRHRSRQFDTLKQAKAFVRHLNERFDRDAGVNLIGISLDDAVRQFLKGCVNLSDATLTDYSQVLGLFVEQLGRDTTLPAIKPPHLDDYFAQRSQRIVRRVVNGQVVTTEVPVSESTNAKHWRYLNRFFRWAVQRDYCRDNPVTQVTVKPRTHVRDLGALPTDKQIAKLIDAIDDDVLKVAALLGLTTGLDRGVIAALTPANFDLDAKTLSTHRRKTARTNPQTLTIPLHKDLCDQLRPLLARTSPAHAVFERYAQRRWYREAREQAGAPWTVLTVADFRKIASARLQRVLPLTSVRSVLGHSSIQTTAKHYSPLDPATLKAIHELPLPSSQSATRKKRRRSSSAA